MLEAGEDHDARVRQVRTQLGQRLQAVHDGHREIEQHDVRFEDLGGVDRLPAIGRGADDLEVVFDLQEQGEELAEVRRVVHDKYAVTLRVHRRTPCRMRTLRVGPSDPRGECPSRPTYPSVARYYRSGRVTS